jgi:hypothetical protein
MSPLMAPSRHSVPSKEARVRAATPGALLALQNRTKSHADDGGDQASAAEGEETKYDAGPIRHRGSGW